MLNCIIKKLFLKRETEKLDDEIIELHAKLQVAVKKLEMDTQIYQSTNSKEFYVYMRADQMEVENLSNKLESTLKSYKDLTKKDWVLF